MAIDTNIKHNRVIFLAVQRDGWSTRPSLLNPQTLHIHTYTSADLVRRETVAAAFLRG